MSVQAYHTLAGRDVEREIVPMAASEGLGLLVWSSLAGGLLSRKFRRERPAVDGTRRAAFAFPPVEMDRAYAVIDQLTELGQRRGFSVARLAIAWLLHQPRVTSVILGAKRLDQLDDTLGAVDVALSDDELAALDEVSRLPAEYPGWMIEMWSAARSTALSKMRGVA